MRYLSCGLRSPWYLPEHYWLGPLTWQTNSVANMPRTRPWQLTCYGRVAYSVCHEALHLNLLEDFNSTEADLMGMKDDILATWKSRDRRRDFIPQTHIHSPHPRIPRNKGPPWEKPLLPEGLLHLSVPLVALVTAWVRHHCHSSGLWPPPPPQDSLNVWLLPYIQELLPTSFPTVGTPTEYNFDPITGWPLKTVDLEYILPAFPTTGGIILNPHQPMHHRSVDLARGEQGEEHPPVVGVPVSLIPSGSGWKNTHCNCVLCHCRDNHCWHHLTWPPRISTLLWQCDRRGYT